MQSDSNRIASSSSSALINQHFSQLGVPFVRDRTVSSLPACSIAVSQPPSPRKRRVRVESEAAECVVCQDGATVCEYGAAACDSCQSFFERTVRLRLIHDCHFRRSCNLRLNRRNHCLGCRWDRCLEVGMSPSAVKKRRSVDTGVETWDSEHKPHPIPWSPHQVATPQPSLSSLTDTEDSSQDSCCGRVSAEGERLGGRLLNESPLPDLPISAALVRSALSPPGLPESSFSSSHAEGLRARLTGLERSCLVELFRWNKRRLVGYSERGFGAAATNWMPILVASAVRHYLVRLPPATSTVVDIITEDLKARMEQRLGGCDVKVHCQLDSLVAGVGELCRHLKYGGCDEVSCLKTDSLANVILMMSDLGEDELLASLQTYGPSSSSSSASSSSSTLTDVIRSLLALTELVRSARPELRALLLIALVADGATTAQSVILDYNSLLAGSDTSGPLSSGDEDASQVPGLIGL